MRYILCVLLSTPCSMALAQSQESVEEWLSKIEPGWQACTKGNYQEAEPLLKEAVDLAKRFGETDGRYAVSVATLALAQQRLGKEEDAQKNGFLAQKIFAAKTGDLLNNMEAARGLYALAQLRQAREQYDDADKLYQLVLTISRTDAVFGKKHPVIGEILCTYGTLLDAEGRFGLAEARFREGIAILDGAELKEARNRLVSCYEAWAQHYRLQGNYLQATAKLTKTLELAREALGAEHAEVARLEQELAALYFQQGKYDQAVEHFQAARALREKAGKEPLALAQVLHNLALAYAGQKKYAEAKKCLEQALELRQKQKGESDPIVASTLHALATLAKQQGQLEEAEKTYRQVLEIKEKAFGPDDPRVADELDSLALVARKRGGLEQAEKMLKRALKIRTDSYGKDHRSVASTAHNLANVLREESKFEQAEVAYRHALIIRSSALGSDHPLLVPILEHYAELLDATKRSKEAQQYRAHIKQIQAAAAAQ